MATVYKNFLSSDVVNTRTLLHEAIPVTGSLVSGTYGPSDVALGSEPHIKTYSHGMFESVYDYPFLSSSANHIFDITCGYAGTSALSGASNTQNSKKISIYNQMAQVLMGYDHTGTIRLFDQDGDITSGTKMKECYFMNFSRLLVKDEIKKGTFALELGVVPAFTETGDCLAKRIKLTDSSGSNGYFVNSPAGEYGILFAQTTDDGDATLSTAQLHEETITSQVSIATSHKAAGLIFYQAGIAVISGSVFNANDTHDGLLDNAVDTLILGGKTAGNHGFDTITGSTVAVMANGLRNRVYDLQFDNTTELNSAIHFCRVNHNEFNYSANPTYLNGSKIRVKGNNRKNLPVSYITSVGLYSADRELLAVAKLSEPLKKDPTTELTLKVRLDY